MIRAHLLITLVTATLLGLPACAEQSNTELMKTSQPVLAGHALTLSNDQGRCKLMRAQTPAVILDMQWPCQFSLNEQHHLRIETVEQTPVFIVERSEHLPAPSRDCLTDVQAVRWYEGRLEPGRSQHIAMCAPSQWDQKMFIAGFDW